MNLSRYGLRTYHHIVVVVADIVAGDVDAAADDVVHRVVEDGTLGIRPAETGNGPDPEQLRFRRIRWKSGAGEALKICGEKSRGVNPVNLLFTGGSSP